jgi:shikimate dehydrogenase
MTYINSYTQLLGLIGWPLSHSFSPAMHNAALQALGLNYVYLPLPVRPEAVGNAVSGLAALGFRGINVTIPHKQAVMPLLDFVDPAAAAIGAVNTIVFEDGQLRGFNTDWTGFSADLATHNIEIKGRDCILLGAGGSARGIVYALAYAGANVHLFARRLQQAEALIADLHPHFSDVQMKAYDLAALEGLNASAMLSTDSAEPLIVNTTPVGMHPNSNASPWPATLRFPSGSIVYDLVYNPRHTRLMQQAQAAGCRAYNGLGMLVHQGAHAFTRWTGASPDTTVMRRALSQSD